MLCKRCVEIKIQEQQSHQKKEREGSRGEQNI